jgi:hypothetical protein
MHPLSIPCLSLHAAACRKSRRLSIHAKANLSPHYRGRRVALTHPCLLKPIPPTSDKPTLCLSTRMSLKPDVEATRATTPLTGRSFGFRNGSATYGDISARFAPQPPGARADDSGNAYGRRHRNSLESGRPAVSASPLTICAWVLADAVLGVKRVVLQARCEGKELPSRCFQNSLGTPYRW